MYHELVKTEKALLTRTSMPAGINSASCWPWQQRRTEQRCQVAAGARGGYFRRNIHSATPSGLLPFCMSGLPYASRLYYPIFSCWKLTSFYNCIIQFKKSKVN